MRIKNTQRKSIKGKRERFDYKKRLLINYMMKVRINVLSDRFVKGTCPNVELKINMETIVV